MSRTTQFIGLSPRAEEFLNTYNSKKLCAYYMTEGMFDEPIMGGIYECILQRSGQYSCPNNEYMDNYKKTYIEVVQAEPWSSGVMIFTCLKDVETNILIGTWTEEEIYS